MSRFLVPHDVDCVRLSLRSLSQVISGLQRDPFYNVRGILWIGVEYVIPLILNMKIDFLTFILGRPPVVHP